MTDLIYVRVPLTREEHAELCDRAQEHRQSIGRMGAIYIAERLRDGVRAESESGGKRESEHFP